MHIISGTLLTNLLLITLNLQVFWLVISDIKWTIMQVEQKEKPGKKTDV